MSAHVKVSEIGACLLPEGVTRGSDLCSAMADTPVPADIEPFHWLGRVLAHFATAERAIGELCIALEMPVEKGPLSSLQHLCHRLGQNKDKRCLKLLKQIELWQSFRPLRHLLAHTSPLVVHDGKGNRYILTRHLAIAPDDVTPDRLWTQEECQRLCKNADSHGQSITAQVRNLLQNSALLTELKKPAPNPRPAPGKATPG